MSEENKQEDTSVVSIDKSPLTIGQKNFMKRMFNHHKDETEHAVAQHKREISKIFESYSKQIAESIGGQNKEMVSQMNKSLADIDKKFSGMYSVLVNKFLVKQEEKVFLAELGVQALLETVAYHICNLASGVDCKMEDRQKFYESFQTEVESKINSLAEEIKKNAQDKMAQAKTEADDAKKDESVAAGPAQT